MSSWDLEILFDTTVGVYAPPPPPLSPLPIPLNKFTVNGSVNQYCFVLASTPQFKNTTNYLFWHCSVLCFYRLLLCSHSD